MEFLKFICPSSPYIWDGNGISRCFSDIMLGFGASMVTFIIIVVLGITERTTRGRRKIYLYEKVFLLLLPVIGACMACFDLILLLSNTRRGRPALYHEWLLRCSQLLVWATILLISRCDCWLFVLSNRVLCFWWLMKPFLGIPTLLATFSSLETFSCINESSIILVDVLFGILVNIIRMKQSSRTNSSMEELLLSCEMGIDDRSRSNPGVPASFLNLMTFRSINLVMEHGAKKQLDFDDLLQLPIDMDPLFCHDSLFNCWEDQRRHRRSDPSLFWTVCYAYGWPYMCLGLLKVLNDCLGFAGPLLLNRLIKYLQEGSVHFDGYLLAISLGLTSILKSFLDTQYTFRLSKLKLKLRSSLMTVIFRKCLHVGLAERSKFSEGEIQTFMSVDVDRTVNMCNSFHDMWSLPLQIGIALYLLYTQVQFAFVAGITITILLIPVNKWIAELIASATKNMMEQKDERVRRTGELLTYIRTLKMYGWELLFSSWLMKTRSLEVKYLATRKYLDAWCVFFWATTPTLFSLFTFGLYVMMGNQLDAATVFTCLALFNNLISPLNSFPWVINGLIDAVISTRRLSMFLSCFENEPLRGQANSSLSSCSSKHFNFRAEEVDIVMKDACCAWSSSAQEVKELILDHVNLAIPKGSLVAVIGEVGSGKSSLLNSILGEMKLIEGSIYSSGSVAYVPQIPWILSGTIRDNIIFGRDYDPIRYSAVLEACALNTDVSLMVGGDMAYIGEKGVNLSGGQRARLALARAVYHGSDLVMLDDVLSAVDAQVACWILSNAILSPLMDQKTCILCTHNIQAISAADMVVIMDKGQVKWVGSPTDCSSSPYASFVRQEELNSPSETEAQIESRDTCMGVQESVVVESEGIDIMDATDNIIRVEERKEGRVETTVYMNYAAFCGWYITVITCLSALLMQASRNGNDLWLSYWVDTTALEEHPTSFYLAILCIFSLANSFLTLVRAFSFAYGGLCAAIQVHNNLLKKLVNAPVAFFDQTPSGRILNRLSSDLYTIDDSLPFILNILLANFVGLLGIALILSAVQVMFLLLILPFSYIYSKIQFYYRATSRELRRLDSVSRSPIYASFSEILDGSSTIRAFKSEDFFLTRFIEHVKMYQKTSYSEIIASLWLSLRLQFLAAFVVSYIAVMAIVGSHGHLPINLGTPGLVGLALSYAAPVVSLLGSFLTSFTETEKELVSVERVLQYMDIPQEELQGHKVLDVEWPFQGEIEFRNVTLRYMPSLPPALRDLNLRIAGGTQVGIVGRTGAGKSSILNALFRLNPICAGHIIVDGINIADVSLRDLRSRFAVVPQTPFLFKGSLRENLDPFNSSDDLKIWKALERCHIEEEVRAAGGLDMEMKESGTSFSVGQRQLLCLARSFLKSTMVLCLDECTANVDTQTASKLKDAISSECRGLTVVTIAHRISTILHMDNVLVLDQGILVEQGRPEVLVQDESSIFSSFAKASLM
ncbi:ABC transporter C family member 13 [Cynara cardunculus var. scolymus]|uniref:ABC transporter C family member 13 n=1 Tax=Cynara cardunculus var. scolymus TaxID=59895 RepID=UPI000D629513|nr:ABC transporter C family member 13 [Cynara cardunculus var. scolymus]